MFVLRILQHLKLYGYVMLTMGCDILRCTRWSACDPNPKAHFRLSYFNNPSFVFPFALAKFLSSLNHPNIVSVHEVGNSDGVVYVVSDFVDGVTLDQWQAINPHGLLHMKR